MGLTRPGIESGSLWWEASRLAAQPPRPPALKGVQWGCSSSVAREPYSGAAVAQWVEHPIVGPCAKQRVKTSNLATRVAGPEYERLSQIREGQWCSLKFLKGVAQEVREGEGTLTEVKGGRTFRRNSGDIEDKVIGLGNKEFYPAAADLDIHECLEYLPSSLAFIIANDINYKTGFDDLVIMLGSFHTLMYFLGVIGDLMTGSGLEDVLQTVYGSNTDNHILTGKAVSRDFRGHMLVDSALSSIILSDILSEEKNKYLAENILFLYDDLVRHKKTISDVGNSESLHKLNIIITEKANDLRKTSMTSEAWLQYQSMVELSRKIVQADFSGCWLSHLNGIRECLPVFAAAGYSNYLKSAYLYLQTMSQLPESDADISIAREAVEISQHCDTVVVGEDTDLLMLLLYQATGNGFTLHFRKLGEPICRNLLFLHAYTDCDSTSYIYRVGKTSAFKKLLNSRGLKEVAQTFCEPKKSPKMKLKMQEEKLC
ncbi:hypothetical protein PR048_009805 [Dryococelus australis]|uniref:Uncharacterized protein n=1 Tax=Dryococelus australis TaxID=614101 RepID=A0ABQ9I0X5_9NEOP|nr:hypothetical protein PR048_009805 [Dryococelus australis]